MYMWCGNWHGLLLRPDSSIGSPSGDSLSLRNEDNRCGCRDAFNGDDGGLHDIRLDGAGYGVVDCSEDG